VLEGAVRAPTAYLVTNCTGEKRLRQGPDKRVTDLLLRTNGFFPLSEGEFSQPQLPELSGIAVPIQDMRYIRPQMDRVGKYIVPQPYKGQVADIEPFPNNGCRGSIEKGLDQNAR
jgi:hypothetical protein